MKNKIITILLILICLLSCVKRKAAERTSNEFTQEELVIIEFATRMEEQEYKYKDYHKDRK